MAVESTTGKRKVTSGGFLKYEETPDRPCRGDQQIKLVPGGPNVNAQQVHFGPRRNHLKGQGQKTLGLCGTTVEKSKVGENKYG